MKRLLLLASVLVVGCWTLETGAAERHVFVDPSRGNDRGPGTRTSPLKTLSAGISRVPKWVKEDITIHLAEGRYERTGGVGRDAQRLELNRTMDEGVRVGIVGNTADFNRPAPPGSVVLNWEPRSSGFLIMVTRGYWSVENVQVGTRTPSQRCGISVQGPGLLELRDVRIRTGGMSSPGLYASHSGRIHLYGKIELNEDLHEQGAEGETFCRVEAEHSGTIKFKQREGASLSVGNGTLDARFYGVIQLGCEQGRITSWTQSNPIAVNSSGRVELNRTTTYLCARSSRNTPIGLEHDGHVMAEGAKIIILGCGNNDAIILQKVSSLFCNDVEIRGKVKRGLMAYSGSTLLAGIIGDLRAVRATTGSRIIIEKCTGRLLGPVTGDKMGLVCLPDGRIVGSGVTGADAGEGSVASFRSPVLEPATLPPLHHAVYGGHEGKSRELIEKGADVSARTVGGLTPLHIAAIRGHDGISRLLLRNGAHVSARDGSGLTSATLAENHGHDGLAEFLRKEEQKDKSN